MRTEPGRIIAIVGPPLSGKTVLTRLLGTHYQATVFEDHVGIKLPSRIAQDIAQNIRPLERILWFRNQLVKKYQHALRFRQRGQIVVLDTFWLSGRFYVDVLAKGFERTIIGELFELDAKLLSWPDVVVYLDVSEQKIRRHLQSAGTLLKHAESFIQQQAVPVAKAHRAYFAKLGQKNVLTARRDRMDFFQEATLHRLVRRIDTTLWN